MQEMSQATMMNQSRDVIETERVTRQLQKAHENVEEIHLMDPHSKFGQGRESINSYQQPDLALNSDKIQNEVQRLGQQLFYINNVGQSLRDADSHDASAGLLPACGLDSGHDNDDYQPNVHSHKSSFYADYEKFKLNN